MDNKVKSTANLYDPNLLINISKQCKFGQQVDKIPISQFDGHPFEHLFWKSYVQREKRTKPTKWSWTSDTW